MRSFVKNVGSYNGEISVPHFGIVSHTEVVEQHFTITIKWGENSIVIYIDQLQKYIMPR